MVVNGDSQISVEATFCDIYSDANTPEAVKQELLLSFSDILHKQIGIYVHGKDFIKNDEHCMTSQNSRSQSNLEKHASYIEKSARTSTPVA